MSAERIVVLDDWTRFWSTQAAALVRLRAYGEGVNPDALQRRATNV